MSNFNVCICGCRWFDDYDFFKEKCLFLLKNKIPNITIISGGASGADKLAEQFAKDYDFELKIFNADWDRYGNSAGPRRNKEMVKIADGIIAFWDGKSKGTKHTINFCKQYNKPCKVVII